MLTVLVMLMMNYIIGDNDVWWKGIDCPRAGRSGPGVVGGSQSADEYGDEALTFTRDLVLQREVHIPSVCSLCPCLPQVNFYL